MKKFLLGFSFALALTAFFAFSPVLQPSKLSQMTADWERAKAFTKEYLDVATDATLTLKPTPQMRSFRDQMLHLAEANYGLVSGATGKKSPISFGQLEKSEGYKTKAEITKAVMDSYDFVIAAVKEQDDAKLANMVKIFNFDLSTEVALMKAFEHQTHHRGQATVYIRLSGLTPPGEKLF